MTKLKWILKNYWKAGKQERKQWVILCGPKIAKDEKERENGFYFKN